MNRAARLALSQETLTIIEARGYDAPSSGRVSIGEAIDASLAETRLFRSEDFPDALDLDRSRGLTRVEVTDETTLAAAARLAGTTAAEVFVLNFASAKNPGGGFLSGSQAQEESLARSSTLYASLMAHFAFYDFHRTSESALYFDNDPDAVAAMSGDLLEGEFAACFAHVVMAIHDRAADREVLSAFQQRFDR